ncbi:MAG: hypothetical protein A3B96_00330 [Candidatus Spechtbacteria bacterium RIFCSPHIGHO2_02_FULL_43_15b]|uniref:SHS2 domain-containing protein n=1 Tax=Candidatus Spechtbacteria bacterium RIFCSPHIGHO2_01_FULL_43_30 TaxID=1802158 RepID=A0A1G2H5G1_9BACT|nr:MAG: hypothetical protein A2827_00750 [Candidatus Spechtbacteria bacterium RIFCSPHIGHO2_01_FULL_43_30]OGZ59323.1 MAG: hypothetical protein A3B96_00330 [Candidatus Spechtbacteria bacterium RIFCSPHIGHO2_02_FULL_43_15b]
MFSNLFKITPEPFGLDISDTSFKIAKLSKKKASLLLQHFGDIDIDAGLLEDGVITDEEKLANVIKNGVGSLTTGDIATRYASCSLPEQKTYLRIVQLPKMEKRDMGDAISWEIEANVPISLSEAYYDWQIIHPVNEDKTRAFDHYDILVSVAPKDLVDSYSRMLKKAGLVPFSFEPESVALVRSIIKGGFSEKPLLVVDLGQARTSFIVYAGSAIRFTSSAKLSGDGISEIIMRSMGVDKSEAERLKMGVGLDRDMDPRVFEAIIPALTDLKEQIQRYMDFYAEHSAHTHNGEPRVSRVLVSGGGALLKGIEKYLALSLNIPVEIANPWVNILGDDVKTIPELPYEESIRYATVLGLSLNR